MNLLAVTDSMVRLTSRNTQTKQEMTESLTARLRALSAAHGLVRKSFGPAGDTSFGPTSEMNGVDLGDLVLTILRPYQTPDLSGAKVRLGGHATNAVALVFHELATNAAKYGALSVDSGAVSIAWRVKDDTLNLQWKEENGPDIKPPTKKGFGSTLVASTISGLGGMLDYDWGAPGLVVRISIPADSLAR